MKKKDGMRKMRRKNKGSDKRIKRRIGEIQNKRKTQVGYKKTVMRSPE